jgi:hypothetical protein
MNFENINAAAAIDKLPLKKVSELTLNEVYIITDIAKVKTKVGDAILVKTDQFKCFIPKKWLEILTEEVIEEMKKNKCGFKLVNIMEVNKPSPAYILEFINL